MTSPESIFSLISADFSSVALETSAASVIAILNVGSPLASVAILTCSFNSVATAKAAIEASEVRSVTSLIAVLTF